ncbi:hypothetical protein FFLO_05020 [Filobasidium floriforme]|uniref:prephenate dehydrogenase (NADP(+)) n=1 Tax=Filobasidium floriforme TaxID=5210 RepID=A0A8K0JI56_9TREE|nr:hypothetical protein FFLO_05020 [Filobasidium floriforme]
MVDVTELNIGIIGMGEMGKMYARRFAAGGMKRIYVCDRPERFEEVKEEMSGEPAIIVMKDGHHVSRISDFIIYSVEAAYINDVVKEYGPSTKMNSIVAGQTSVKAPEKEAFEKYLPADVHIVSIHSLHGPTVTTEGQPLVIIKYRATDAQVETVVEIFKSFKSNYVHLSYEEHDLVTANTQAVTHAAFLSMGTAWKETSDYPWETTRYVGGIEIVKINITLRIYSNKWHVYAGLAILNPSAREQIGTYADSSTQIFKLMIEEKKEELRERMFAAREGVFGWTRQEGSEQNGIASGSGSTPVPADGKDHSASSSKARTARKPILLSDRILDQFSLGVKPEPGQGARPNSHLSLMAMVDCWHRLGIKPYDHLDVAGTPVFMLWIGVAEYLFRSPERLEAAIEAAIYDKTHRSDDTEFCIAARGWSQCVSFGNFDLYRDRFEQTASFFAPRFEEAAKVGGKMIKTIQEESKRTTT